MKKICAALIVIVSMFMLNSVWPHSSQATISNAERNALIDLYNSTGGDLWTDNSGWKEPPLETDGFAAYGTEGSWFGVHLDSLETSVIELEYYDNNLQGTIPGTISDLTNLEKLRLYKNNLLGSIPTVIGNLTNFKVLNLRHNQLSGPIP